MMETRVFRLSGYIENKTISSADEEMIREAAGIIARGGLVAFPTETVYGLGANALTGDAAKRIYLAKGRPSDNPLIVHIADMDELKLIAKNVPDEAFKLADRFWPGPLTMVLDKSPMIPGEITGGLNSVAVRMPSHEAARRLIELAGVPIAAPSANISGKPSTTSASHCVRDLWGKIEGILDAGDADIGLESTIVDLTTDTPMLLRPGAVTVSMLESALNTHIPTDPAVTGKADNDSPPKAPGMKYRHYAPEAPMVLVAQGESEETFLSLIRESGKKYDHIGVLCSSSCLKRLLALDPTLRETVSFAVSGEDIREVAAGIYKGLRELDEGKADLIIAEGYTEEELGQAVMNRLKKASGYNIYEEGKQKG